MKASTCDASNNLVLLEQEVQKIVVNQSALARKLTGTKHPITQQALHNAYKATEQVMLYKVQAILDLLEADAAVLRRACGITGDRSN